MAELQNMGNFICHSSPHIKRLSQNKIPSHFTEVVSSIKYRNQPQKFDLELQSPFELQYWLIHRSKVPPLNQSVLILMPTDNSQQRGCFHYSIADFLGRNFHLLALQADFKIVEALSAASLLFFCCSVYLHFNPFLCTVLIDLVKQVHRVVSCTLFPSHQDVLEEWLKCQCSWLYLEPIFRSEDIKRQLPAESERYQAMDTEWRIIMKNANENPEVCTLMKTNASIPDSSDLYSREGCI